MVNDYMMFNLMFNPSVRSWLWLPLGQVVLTCWPITVILFPIQFVTLTDIEWYLEIGSNSTLPEVKSKRNVLGLSHFVAYHDFSIDLSKKVTDKSLNPTNCRFWSGTFVSSRLNTGWRCHLLTGGDVSGRRCLWTASAELCWSKTTRSCRYRLGTATVMMTGRLSQPQCYSSCQPTSSALKVTVRLGNLFLDPCEPILRSGRTYS